MLDFPGDHLVPGPERPEPGGVELDAECAAGTIVSHDDDSIPEDFFRLAATHVQQHAGADKKSKGAGVHLGTIHITNVAQLENPALRVLLEIHLRKQACGHQLLVRRYCQVKAGSGRLGEAHHRGRLKRLARTGRGGR